MVPPPAAAALTWPQVWAFRAQRHSLTTRRPAGDLIELVSELCGLHAQVMSSAELTALARLDGFDRAAVRDALWSERTLFKTWAMRGTLHLLPTQEFNLYAAALGRSRHHRRPAWLRAAGLTEDELDALLGAIHGALDGGALTREELGAAVAGELGRPELAEQVQGSWGSFLKPAAMQGRLCFAPSDDRLVRFTRPDRWLRTTKEHVDPDEGIAEILRRFLRAYGPSRREDLARWWGFLTAAQARKLTETLDVSVVDLDGERAYALTEDLDALQAAAPSGLVRTLPQFDQYVVGAWRTQPDIAPVRPLIYREAGWISAVVLIDGRIAGTWKGDAKGTEVTLFERVKAPLRRTIAEELARLGFTSQPTFR